MFRDLSGLWVRRVKLLLACSLIGTGAWVDAAPMAPVDLAAANAALQQRVDTLESELAALRRQVDALAGRVQTTAAAAATAKMPAERSPVPAREVVRPGGAARVVISGEVGVTYTDGQRESRTPTGEFRLDDAKLFVDAEVTRGIYAYAEADITTRENQDEFQMGELYLEVEDVAGRLGMGGALDLTLRLGRLDVPFGEEYLSRGALLNPLITHSLADFWGVDEGVEVFGSSGGVSYFLAVQNGSHDALGDGTDDKAVTLRLSYDLTSQLHVAASAMRTGAIDPTTETLSELWWGGAFLRSIGNGASTTEFAANLWQLEGTWSWPTGHLRAAGGVTYYDDDDTSRDNRRAMRHVVLEGVQEWGRGAFGAVRYSWIDTDGGYPIAGLGSFGKYFFGPFQSREVWRLGLGLGYRWTDDILLKLEYTLERGTLTNGSDRQSMDQIATQAAVRF